MRASRPRSASWSHRRTQTATRPIADADPNAADARLTPRTPGRLYVGTSGFAYPDWAPLFYPPGTPWSGLLPAYAKRLDACELNNTFYQRPTPERIARWLADTPVEFRFSVKAQRSSSMRALLRDAADAVAWLTEPLPRFGDRMATVLFRVPKEIPRNDEGLDRLLGAWPPALPLTMEFQDPSWRVDEVLDRLRVRAVTLCATDLDEDPEPPPLDRTGPFLYLRLRRTAYSDAELKMWAERVVPFLEDGSDVFAFFRHDEDGTSALRAIRFRELVARRVTRPPARTPRA